MGKRKWERREGREERREARGERREERRGRREERGERKRIEISKSARKKNSTWW